MKRTFKYILLHVGAIVTMTSCYNYDWNFDHETTLSAFNITSADQTVTMTVNYADSTDNAGSELQLDWTKSFAADYSKVFYEVLFFNANDLSKPVYTGTPGTKQTENFIRLSEKKLNIIAEKAGIPQGATGDVLWKVRASNGINEFITEEHRKLALTRPDGFAYYPERIFIKGSAIATEVEMKRLKKGDDYTGEYELFFFAAEGDFYMAEKGSDRKFYVTEDGKFKELFGADKETTANAVISKNKIHRVRINMKKSLATAVSVESVGVWYSGTNSIWAEMEQPEKEVPYWSVTKRLELVNEGALPDYRYKFRMTQKNINGTESYSFWGYSTASAPNQTESSQPSYFMLNEVDDSRSNYCYKFARTGHDQYNLKIDADFSFGAEFFRHYVTVK